MSECNAEIYMYNYLYGAILKTWCVMLWWYHAGTGIDQAWPVSFSLLPSESSFCVSSCVRSTEVLLPLPWSSCILWHTNKQILQSTIIHNVLWRSSQSMFVCTHIDIYSTRSSRVVSVGLISTKPHPPTTYLMLGTSEGGSILCSLICLCTLILY